LFPPYNNNHNKEKEENCEEGVVGEEGQDLTTVTSADVTTTKSTTLKSTVSTTTKKPYVLVSNSQSATAGDTSEGEEESSVAEAKPVGLAIAGIGGVASSKPVGTAVVGPGGLAVGKSRRCIDTISSSLISDTLSPPSPTSSDCDRWP
jgi:hypothetical protein